MGKKTNKSEMFVASNKPFPYWWNRNITLYGEDAKKAEEYIEDMELVLFSRQGRDFIPLYENQKNLRIWNFNFIAKQDANKTTD